MTAEKLFWCLAAELSAVDPRIVESTIMNGCCLRVGKGFWRWSTTTVLGCAAQSRHRFRRH
jgi:hypothetical protein